MSAQYRSERLCVMLILITPIKLSNKISCHISTSPGQVQKVLTVYEHGWQLTHSASQMSRSPSHTYNSTSSDHSQNGLTAYDLDWQLTHAASKLTKSLTSAHRQIRDKKV